MCLLKLDLKCSMPFSFFLNLTRYYLIVYHTYFLHFEVFSHYIPRSSCKSKFLLVLERPPSQMSYLDQFLKETNTNQQNQQLQYENQASLLYQGGSIESEEGDIEDNRALSISSSKSNLSESSLVSVMINLIFVIFWVVVLIFLSVN